LDIFHQTQTAHKKLDFIKSSDVNQSFNVWLPFHFLPAAKNIFIFLREFLLKNDEFGSVDENKSLDFRLSKIKETLKFRGTLEERYNNWLNKINNNYFKFEDFDNADWTLYMKAAAEHKYKVIHEILPQAGLSVG
jgi:hypothetical protein